MKTAIATLSCVLVLVLNSPAFAEPEAVSAVPTAVAAFDPAALLAPTVIATPAVTPKELAKATKPTPNKICKVAHEECYDDCGSAFDDIDVDYTKEIGVDGSDGLDDCEEACASGRYACNKTEEEDKRCSSFKAACENKCPAEHLGRGGAYHLHVLGRDSCMEACEAGEDACVEFKEKTKK